MEFNIDQWMEEYCVRLKSLFDSRLRFVGIQGSYGRNEATENSDIDAVVILDQLAPADLKAYSEMLDSLRNRAKICGFISGWQELIHWEPSDLFQFYHDTKPIIGNLDDLLTLISNEDVLRAIRIGACNVYHACVHNMVHEKDPELLKNLYKSAAFTLQAICFVQSGTYIKKSADLLSLLAPPDKEILQIGMNLKKQPHIALNQFEQLSELLFQWAAGVISRNE